MDGDTNLRFDTNRMNKSTKHIIRLQMGIFVHEL